jgi:uncharacterized membrane protein YraQ (UPF0718 family)
VSIGQIIKDRFDLVFSIFAAIVVGGLVGYYAARIGMIDRINIIEKTMTANINQIEKNNTAIDSNLKNLDADLKEIKTKIEPITDIENKVNNIDRFIRVMQDSEPDRIRREERFRHWKDEISEKVKRLETSE